MKWFSPVWLISKRELRDQFRDWRILLPLFILTVLFPLLMNQVAKATVEFVGQYGGTLIVDRLVPFSVLIIGFFPITVSLVVALESFVGEKERGTIEPLLSTPLEDWHMYLGKLIVGVFTPLMASFSAIGFYLVIVSRQQIVMPEFSIFLQLFALTIAHAVLMVSAAIVISVQSTSVKAANLLASFIVIPVAILMQGESALLFWGNNKVLWLAVLAVLILAALLIRVGLAHFQREYMLGREIDVLNFRWMWLTFRKYFKGESRSVLDWYRYEVIQSLAKMWISITIMLIMAIAVFWVGFQWTITVVPQRIEATSPDAFREIAEEFSQPPPIFSFGQDFSALYIFSHNLRAVGVIFLAGLVSFSILGVLVYIINLGAIGVVLGVLELMGFSTMTVGIAGLVPHGIFELPALLLASAAVLRMGAVLVTPQVGRSMGEVLIESLAYWTKIVLGLVVPLLILAAIIEAYVTPAILMNVI